MTSSSYYDIDSILAEEELVPCSNLFDFSRLAHLSPDHTTSPTSGAGAADSKALYLPEHSSFKMPLWSIEQWTQLGFVNIGIPKHFRQTARERLLADPSQADLRRYNERFYASGLKWMDLVSSMSSSDDTSTKSTTSTSSRHQRRQQEINDNEAKALRTTLLQTYTGDRLRRTLDYAMSSVGDDVSFYTRTLTEMERRLFQRGSSGATAFSKWKTFGNRRIEIGIFAQRAAAMESQHQQLQQQPQRIVTPDNGTVQKRQRTR
eukprot:CAMPEP_0195295480 /NCGR_PEP_ID=MMETSP0707-20130614/17494_1 /TAXON_ID=33640 /ORGANISM="Asterionellopsis glacialis, Strain CCMP134" /LENGTH=261 /DNA_ID=CAMNT_0040356721 /DNA_START=74 /DNA_END=859 /DNA_ORIENTATION=+